MAEVHDRRTEWTVPERPEWLAKFNSLGPLLDIEAIVPLDADSLTSQATRNTGLDDFGDEDGWRQHFEVLLSSIAAEANLNFFGRIYTRAELLMDLQARLKVIDAYKRHPEIDDEVIVEPVFIVGFGRSGTTILQDTLAQDPQFRSVRRWEAQFPWPPPEEATYESDERVQRAQNLVDVVHEICPAWPSMHAWGGDLTVEDIEFTHGAFFSEVWECAYQIPSYVKYFAESDNSYHYEWHSKMLKLLQWKFKRNHWLLKNPTHLQRLPQLLKQYPDAKLIFTHRDPIVSGDSVVNVMGTVYHQRTDDPWGSDEVFKDQMLPDLRAKTWDTVIEWIETGVVKPGSFTNFRYAEFKQDPMSVLTKMYDELGLQRDEQVFRDMQEFLGERNKGTHGNTNRYQKTAAGSAVAQEERSIYQRYQEYFDVASEV